MFQKLCVGPLRNIALMMAYTWELERPVETLKAEVVDYIMKSLADCLERHPLFKIPQQPPAAVRTTYAQIAEKYGHKIMWRSGDANRIGGDTYTPLPEVPQLRFIRLVAEFNLGESPRICRFDATVQSPLL